MAPSRPCRGLSCAFLAALCAVPVTAGELMPQLAVVRQGELVATRFADADWIKPPDRTRLLLVYRGGLRPGIRAQVSEYYSSYLTDERPFRLHLAHGCLWGAASQVVVPNGAAALFRVPLDDLSLADPNNRTEGWRESAKRYGRTAAPGSLNGPYEWYPGPIGEYTDYEKSQAYRRAGKESRQNKLPDLLLSASAGWCMIWGCRMPKP